jgi:hypothetical protein
MASAFHFAKPGAPKHEFVGCGCRKGNRSGPPSAEATCSSRAYLHLGSIIVIGGARLDNSQSCRATPASFWRSHTRCSQRPASGSTQTLQAFCQQRVPESGTEPPSTLNQVEQSRVYTRQRTGNAVAPDQVTRSPTRRLRAETNRRENGIHFWLARLCLDDLRIDEAKEGSCARL